MYIALQIFYLTIYLRYHIGTYMSTYRYLLESTLKYFPKLLSSFHGTSN